MADYFVLERAKDAPKGSILTAALVHCMCCGRVLAAMGGPRDALCERCVEWIRHSDGPDGPR